MMAQITDRSGAYSRAKLKRLEANVVQSRSANVHSIILKLALPPLKK